MQNNSLRCVLVIQQPDHMFEADSQSFVPEIKGEYIITPELGDDNKVIVKSEPYSYQDHRSNCDVEKQSVSSSATDCILADQKPLFDAMDMESVYSINHDHKSEIMLSPTKSDLETANNQTHQMGTDTGGNVDKEYKCDACEYMCSTKQSLMRHFKSHTGEKPYKCDSCDYRCSLKHNLARHQRSRTVQRVEKPYKCDTCGYSFALNAHLKEHRKIHTGEKSHKCNICEYRCLRKHDLKTHMMRHTGEKSYECDVCDYKSARKDVLTNHMKTHLGEKPYGCEVCKYRCLRKFQLTRHMTTHTRSKAYKCDICELICSNKSSFMVHMNTHMSENI